MTTTDTTRVTIALDGSLLAAIQQRDGTTAAKAGRPSPVPVEAMRRDLSRYYAVIDRALSSLDLTEAEASAIADAMNGTWAEWGGLDDMSAKGCLVAEIYDGMSPEIGDLARKWSVDATALNAKVAAWSETQALAVIDAVERFWADCQTSTVQSVGLVR